MIPTNIPPLLLGIALLTLLLVQAFKSDAIPINVPPRFRPVVASVLAGGGAIATLLLKGVPVADAVIMTLLTAVAPSGLFAAVTKPKDTVQEPTDVRVVNQPTAVPTQTFIVTPQDVPGVAASVRPPPPGAS